jgi:hypothetical protein
LYRAPGHRVGPSVAARLWLAFASLVGVFIASLIVAPVASIVMIGIFALISGPGSGEPLLPADRVPLALQVLTEGFAAFATAVLLLGTSGAIQIARRVVPTDDDSSTAAIVFATVLVADLTAGAGFLGPYWFPSHLTPTVVVVLLGAAALAGTIPLRTKARVSPWLYACLGLIVAAPLGVAGAWRLQRPSVPRVVQSTAPLSGPVETEMREFARSTRPALTIVAIAPDGTVYYSDGARLTARRLSGSEAWFHEWEDPKLQFARGVVAADGTLYVAGDFRVYAFGGRGETRWIYDDGSRTEPQILGLGSGGTVYVGVTAGIRPSLRAVAGDGTEQWRVNVKATAISVGHDGRVFVAGDKVLSAYTADGRLVWTQTLDFTGQPAIGEDGTLYLAGSRTLTAVRPDGTLRWSADTATERQEDGRTPVIGARGEVYVANSNLWAVDADGAIKWRWTPPVSDPSYTLDHAPLVALDGTVVVAAVNGTVYGITPEGTLRWMHEQGSQIHALALGPSGAIYLVVHGAIVTIHPPSGASAGRAVWPEERHDAQNTSHAAH